MSASLCKKCGVEQCGVCKKSGFVYDWCGKCYKKGKAAADDWIQEFSYSGSSDAGKPDFAAEQVWKYEIEMREKKTRLTRAA